MNTPLMIIAVFFAISVTLMVAAGVAAAMIMAREWLRIRQEKESTRP